MHESALDAVFREVPRSSLEAETAVCFVLDEKLRIIYCNPFWDRFATENNGAHVCAEKVLGMPVLDSTSGELRAYYQALFEAALEDGKPKEQNFHCSSPELERLLRMHIYPLKSMRALLVVCSTRLERPHPLPSGEPQQQEYRNEHGFIVMCSNCRRCRRVNTGSDTWDWISDFVAREPAAVSHSICGVCLEYYYSFDY